MEYKFEHHWGGEDNWYTKSKRWANKQKFPINHLALGLIELVYKHWVDGKVEMEMDSVDRQAEEILEMWYDIEDDKPHVDSNSSEVEGLDEIRIKAPWEDK